jgi:predicted methyltransferase
MNRFARPVVALALILAAGAVTPVLAQRPNIAAATDESRGNALNNAEFKGPEVIRFIGLKKGMKVADIFAGRFTTAFVETVGPKGKVYAVTPQEIIKIHPELPALLAERAKRPEYANVEQSQPAINEMALPKGQLDAVFIRQNYHDLHVTFMGPADVPVFNRKVFEALKPGGVFVVLDHVALAGSGMAGPQRLHRIDPEIVKAEVTAAGFKFDGESKVLANPADDHSKMVLDPAILGKTDQFILRFRKPK